MAWPTLEEADEILLDGSPEQIRSLAGSGVRYSYSPECGGFTVKVGRAESRMCKVLDAPNCVTLYGNEHEFI